MSGSDHEDTMCSQTAGAEATLTLLQTGDSHLPAGRRHAKTTQSCIQDEIRLPLVRKTGSAWEKIIRRFSRLFACCVCRQSKVSA